MANSGGGLSSLIPSKQTKTEKSNIPESNPTEEVQSEKTSSDETGKVYYIKVSNITPNPYQPRKNFNKNQLQELADSIKEHGILQPIVVTKTEHGYQLISGQRRLEAAKIVGLDKISAIVRQSKDNEKLELALIENIQRDNLNPIEKAYAFKKMVDEFNLTQKDISKKIGKSRELVANALRLLELPAEIQRAILEDKITEGHARIILILPKFETKIYLFKQILKDKLSIRQARILSKKLYKGLPEKSKPTTRKDDSIKKIEDELSDKLSTKVSLTKTGQKGKLTIRFYSSKDLDTIIKKLKK